MTSDALVTDPTLLSVLQSAAQARQQSLAILDILDEYHSGAAHDATAEEQLALSKQQKLLNSHLARLRGLNRDAIMGVRNTKQETAEARQEIDSLHLQLQNLYYEQRHLRGEIAGCNDYDHKYLQLPLIPADEFVARHPQLAEASDHDLMNARIEDEYAARQALAEQKQQLQKRKEGLVKETAAKKDELAKLDTEMEKWLSGSEAVRKMLEAREKRATEALEKDPAAQT